MPYIKKEKRRIIAEGTNLQNDLIGAASKLLDTEGDLNYFITKLCFNFLYKKGECYATYNTLIGVLECAKLEFYRKKVAFYEDKKEQENGPIITSDKI